MKKKIYRPKLELFLIGKGLTKGSAGVYLAGSNNKKPNGDIRYDAEKELGHPYKKWGKAIVSYLKQRELEEQQKLKGE